MAAKERLEGSKLIGHPDGHDKVDVDCDDVWRPGVFQGEGAASVCVVKAMVLCNVGIDALCNILRKPQANGGNQEAVAVPTSPLLVWIFGGKHACFLWHGYLELDRDGPIVAVSHRCQSHNPAVEPRGQPGLVVLAALVEEAAHQSCRVQVGLRHECEQLPLGVLAGAVDVREDMDLPVLHVGPSVGGVLLRKVGALLPGSRAPLKGLSFPRHQVPFLRGPPWVAVDQLQFGSAALIVPRDVHASLCPQGEGVQLEAVHPQLLRVDVALDVAGRPD
mmetsp:Transcript_5276/g.14721  ORF Transcript_5276/g.14721 Transcript_5276/m.14721 type:complete len:276 (-) Transcript_5276:810-1637(-)